MEVFIPVYSLFWGLFMLGAAILTNKLRWKNKKSILNTTVLAVGFIVFAVNIIPLVSVPNIIKNADTAYRESFGSAYLDDSVTIEQNGFMRTHFSLQDYFIGTRTREYVVIEDILYHEETTGSGDEVRLYFDVYMPLDDGSYLPGQNSVLIRIHGGAWVIGSKGAMNYAATNKHFVNLGYVVFDIQYGLNNQSSTFAGLPVPENVRGDFNIDDMIRHIGIFTTFLADHADEYGTNLDSVFISGASAGGQLAIASALGITSGRYTDTLDPRLHIRGIIPFYPANGLAPNVGIGGTPDLVDPVLLIGDDSPPCLIFHGTHDGMVDPMIASALQRAYEEKSGAPSALLWMNFASHGSDIYTPGYYSQIFLYYMERFMYQNR